MLDKPTIGIEEDDRVLKCEECGIIFSKVQDEDDYNCIDEHGVCISCGGGGY